MSEIEAQMSFEERRAFIASLFTVLESTGAVTLTDLTEQSLRQAAAMAQTLVKDGRVRGFLLSLLNQMLRVTVSNVSGPVRGRLRMFRRGGKRKAVQEGEPADRLAKPRCSGRAGQAGRIGCSSRAGNVGKSARMRRERRTHSGGRDGTLK